MAEIRTVSDGRDRFQAQVDASDHLYNTERPHQGLPGRVTPLTAWEAIEKAEPPHPQPEKPFSIQAAKKHFQPAPPPTDLPAGTTIRRLTSTGTFMLSGVIYMVGGQYGFQQVLVTVNDNQITVAHFDGVILI